MKTTTLVMFGDEERRTFERLSPYGTALGFDDDDKPTLGRLITRATAHTTGDEFEERFTEPLDMGYLERLEEALVRLHGQFYPQTEASWWINNSNGATLTSAETFESLAELRRQAIGNIEDALAVVDRALVLLRAALVATGTVELYAGVA